MKMATNDIADETVEISVQTAETALSELDILIQQTGGSEGSEYTMTPLALAKYLIKDELENMEDGNDSDLEEAVEIINEVGEITGQETAPIDPLTGGTFDARTELEQAFEKLSEPDMTEE